MACVMPPASPSATPVWRMASRSEVLPWSTWPMTVTHRRARLEVGRVVVEREGVLLLLGHDLDVTPEVVGHELDELVGHGLGQRERGAQQEEALDDVVGRHAEELGELAHGGALRDPHGVELREVLVVGDGLLDAVLLGGLLGLLLAALLAALAAPGGLAGRLLDGHAGLLEDAAPVIGLGLARHAAVAVPRRPRRDGPSCRGGRGRRRRTPARSGRAAPRARGRSRGARPGGRPRRGGRARPSRRPSSARPPRLALEDLLLLRDLVEQGREGRDGLRRVVAHAVLLGLLAGLALGLGAGLLLGLALGLGRRRGGAPPRRARARGAPRRRCRSASARSAAMRASSALGLGLGALGGLDLGRRGPRGWA